MNEGTPTDPALAARLHREAVVIDGLNASHFQSPVVLERLLAGGVTAVNITVAAWHGQVKTMCHIGEMYEILERHSDQVMAIGTASDIARAKATGRVGIILGFQGTDPIEEDIRMLAVYRALGVRIMQLTYNLTNRVGSGYRVPEDSGLTPFGRRVVAEMNRLGILIDLSHCGDRTTREGIEASERPVAITHANSRRFCDSRRNKSPEVLKLLAERGGMIGAMNFPSVLTGDKHATLDDYIHAIEDLMDIVGVDRVGLGPDFMELMPREVLTEALSGFSDETINRFFGAPPTLGFESIALLPNVTGALLARGHREEDVRKILGGNWLRFYEEAWEAQVSPRESLPRIAPANGFGRRRTDPDYRPFRADPRPS